MKYRTFAAAALFAAIAACSASGAVGDPELETKPVEQRSDGEAPGVDAGPSDSDAPDVDLDAERPLLCGDAGFCETRLPKSDVGLPLSLRSVWVAGANDVWSVSLEGFILHYDGASWTTEYKADHELYAVWATPTSVWAGGEAGLLLHRDAAGEWSLVDSGHVGPIRSIYGSDDSDVWFTRDDAAVTHFDGSTLSNKPIGIPGLELTTVFGRPGFGTYAAGHVPGVHPVSGLIQDQPYVFSLSDDDISVFSTSLTQQRRFIPISGAVTDSTDPERRVLLVGWEERANETGNTFIGRYCLFGPSNPVSIRNVKTNLYKVDSQRAADRRHPVLAYQESDIWVVWSLGVVATFDGSERVSLDLGLEFQPRDVFAAHNDSTSSWLVGDGFALKGARP